MWHSPTRWPEQRPPEPEPAEQRSSPGWWRRAGVVVLAAVAACGIGVVARLGDDVGLEPLGVERSAAGELEDSILRDEERRLAEGREAARRVRESTLRAWAAETGGVGAGEAAPGGGLAALPFVPFHQKRGEWLRGARLGYWPAERRPTRDPAYANPRGFYVVTPASYHHPVSQHFTLGEFTMRDGAARTAESYLVLQPVLLDKLERVVGELRRSGIRGADLRVLSGFRAPRYNGGVEGAAPASRHQFGDAVDVVLDANGDGRMDDVNRDGRVDRVDLYLFADAVERVERAVPGLVGGLGMYDATGPSGPFLHIDVRGRAARWGTAVRGGARPEPSPWWAARPASATTGGATAPAARPRAIRTGTCQAEGEMAALCLSRKEIMRGGE